ncbi:5'-nucleotidase C-terminal domain-containing protein [Paenibacillus sp. N3.4]|uniref:5'-nucleotidase C-terminal domain-containing protein n=1 Tax=Paenibacillus sp. N3.4 TaxID=2603222 RepID=UPI0011C915BA|nr:5'-nucleotidase C-terminal domain-containing protein [Paenibacillus sp. N3.4]TXK83607.1 hypothetical protein FU659_12755 [Paenibacillus sp. N3.4]
MRNSKSYKLVSKALISTMLASVVAAPFASLSLAETAISYKDLEGSYAQKEIVALTGAGILSGDGSGLFNPNEQMTRAQLAKVLVKAMNLPEESAPATFKDVPKDSWYNPYVGALVKKGITQGTSLETFSPDGQVSREQMAVFFIRALGIQDNAKKLAASPLPFTDAASISSWAKGEVALAFNIGLISGVQNSDNTISFSPSKPAERQALAKLTYQFVQNKADLVSKAEQVAPKEDKKDLTKPEPGKPVGETTTPSTPSTPSNSDPSSENNSASLTFSGNFSDRIPTRLVNTLNRTQEDFNGSLSEVSPAVDPILVALNNPGLYKLAAQSDSPDNLQLWAQDNTGNWFDINHLSTSMSSVTHSVYNNVYAVTDKPGTYNVTFKAYNLGGQLSKTESRALSFRSPKDPVKVKLLSFNDLHGQIDQSFSFKTVDVNGDGRYILNGVYGEMDYMAAYMKKRAAANPNTLLVHAGDAVGGSPLVSSMNKEEPTVMLMNSMGFDVGTVGNHEFDKGTTEMLRLINGGDASSKAIPDYMGMGFPLIAANVVDKTTGNPILPPYAIKSVGGVKIGFIGVVIQSAAGMILPSGIESIRFTDEAAAINKYVAELKKQGIRSIVVLAHMDATQDASGAVTGPAADLANKVDPEVDVILAGHNHKIVNGTVNGKLIFQGYEYGKAIGDIDLVIDPVTGDVIEKSAEVVLVDQAKIDPDPRIKAQLNRFNDTVVGLKTAKVGVAGIDMVGGYTVTSDNALGNLIADSMRVSMSTDFALMNGGGIRQNLSAGDITMGQLFTILPFNNFVVKLDITGEDLVAIINGQLSPNYAADFSISGFKYTWDVGSQSVTRITLPDGKPIDPKENYTIAVNNFMASSTGKSYLEIGKRGKNPFVGPVDSTALIDYVKSFNNEPISYVSEGRVTTTTSNMTPTVGSNVYVNSLPKDYVVRLYNNISDTKSNASATVPVSQFVTLPLDSAVTGPIAITVSTGATATEGYKYTVSLDTYQLNPNNVTFVSPTSAANFTVNGVQPGQVVRVYASPFDLAPISTLTVAGGQNSVSFTNLPVTGSTVYITLATHASSAEGQRTPAGYAASIQLNKYSNTLTAGGATFQLSVTGTIPANPINKTVTWESNNPAVATVDSSGVVTPISKGTAIIFVYVNGRFNYCTITVN